MTFTGKIVGAEMCPGDRTLIHVEVAGYHPIQMSGECVLTIGAPSTPAPATGCGWCPDCVEENGKCCGKTLAPAPSPVEEARDERVFWSVSSDEEHFTGDFDTKEEAIRLAPEELGLQPGDRFWIGKGSLYTVGTLRVDDLFERMSQDACEECGEVAEDWQPAPDKTCEAEIHAAVMRCLERRKDVPGFWCVNGIECHRAPVESSTDGKGGET